MRLLDVQTLQIQGTVGKADLKAEWGVDDPNRKSSEQAADAENVDNKFDEGTGAEAIRQREQGQSSNGRASPEQTMIMRPWLKERRTGAFVRTFYLPSAIDTNGIRARLSQGLLKIVIPKMRESVLHVKKQDIEIEATEY